MRLDKTNIENVKFAEKLTEIGTNPTEVVQLPSEVRKCSNVEELLKATYPGLEHISTAESKCLNERTILAARNDDVYTINNSALDMFPGDIITRLAADKMQEVDERDPTSHNHIPSEYLNTLDRTPRDCLHLS
ncbi:hypothetical protein ACHQM5_027201 [Ranunculus cassubicifolius]